MSEPDVSEAHRAVEAVARDSYGRLVAWLCTRTRDVAAAEDALGEALGSQSYLANEFSGPISS